MTGAIIDTGDPRAVAAVDVMNERPYAPNRQLPTRTTNHSTAADWQN